MKKTFLRYVCLHHIGDGGLNIFTLMASDWFVLYSDSFPLSVCSFHFFKYFLKQNQYINKAVKFIIIT